MPVQKGMEQVSCKPVQHLPVHEDVPDAPQLISKAIICLGNWIEPILVNSSTIAPKALQTTQAESSGPAQTVALRVGVFTSAHVTPAAFRGHWQHLVAVKIIQQITAKNTWPSFISLYKYLPDDLKTEIDIF